MVTAFLQKRLLVVSDLVGQNINRLACLYYYNDNLIVIVLIIEMCEVQSDEVDHVCERRQRQRSHRSRGTSI